MCRCILVVSIDDSTTDNCTDGERFNDSDKTSDTDRNLLVTKSDAVIPLIPVQSFTFSTSKCDPYKHCLLSVKKA